jgi:putative addiction module component (TIGR02574 family)
MAWYRVYMSTLTKADVLSLSVPERIQLVEDIWDSIAELPEEVGLTAEQKAELDRRLDAYHENPEEGSPWGMVRERIRSRR